MSANNYNNTNDDDNCKDCSVIDRISMWFQNMIFIIFSFVDSSIMFKIKVWIRRNKIDRYKVLYACLVVLWMSVLTFLWVWSCGCLLVHGIGAGGDVGNGVNLIDRQDL